MPPGTRLRIVILGALALAAGVASAERPAPVRLETEAALLLGPKYPLRATGSFPAALLHWLDALANLSGAGFTAGKTVAAHRLSYVESLGKPTDEDQDVLREFRDVRVAYANSSENDRDGLTRAFFEAASLEEAFEAADALLAEHDGKALRRSVSHFAATYRQIWDQGRVAGSFVAEALENPRRRELARFLVGIAGFFEVEPDGAPRPRLILAPVLDGFGTHAQAIDEYLLIEVRPGEGLLDQVAPIVHENSHLLFYRMEPERLASLRSTALARGPAGRQAWHHLREALPTAIAQGVAHWKFRPDSWSMNHNWYHREAVDAYAKAIFPFVKRALATGRVLDTEMIDEMVSVFAGSAPEPASETPATTPRSP